MPPDGKRGRAGQVGAELPGGRSGGTEMFQATEVGKGLSGEEMQIPAGGSVAGTIKIKTSCQKCHPKSSKVTSSVRGQTHVMCLLIQCAKDRELLSGISCQEGQSCI